jgi:redox-sensing transcriptional repressor
MSTAQRSDDREAISEMTTGRLSVYLRCLESLDETTISSRELADRFHLNAAQIRKDLAHFGEFGIRGVGYNVGRLKQHLIRTLGIDRPRHAVIVGAGNLGMALADYKGFNSEGFLVVALIDSDPKKIGQVSKRAVTIEPPDRLPEIVRRLHVEIGIIAVGPAEAQAVCDTLVDSGICAILNFAPVQMRLRDGVKIKSVDLRINLESLSFFLKNAEDTLCAAG